jgi:hypothetical protein
MMIAEIQFESSANFGRRGGGGGGARGGRGAGQAGPPPSPGFPRGFKVETSTNGTAWTQIASGAGTGANTVITFKPTTAKFVRLTQTAATEGAPPWSIVHLQLFEAAKNAR